MPLTARQLVLLLLVLPAGVPAQSSDLVLTARMHHLRAGAAREWSSFPADAEGSSLSLTFDARSNAGPQTLKVRHRDLTQRWRVLVNGVEIARLPPDENDMITCWSIAPGSLKDGANTLQINGPSGGASDDVVIGEIVLVGRPLQAALAEARLVVSVTERATNRPLPARITVTDRRGVMVSPSTRSDRGLAVRPGVVYTGAGRAALDLPAGSYRIHAGRGFEYSVATSEVTLTPGATVSRDLVLDREVDTAGWAALDTHIHTLTYSKHGDADVREQMVAIAGEGIELPVSTEHNQRVAFDEPARAAGVRDFFTPLIGSEVTTSVGHFNAWPLAPDGPAIDARVADWAVLAGRLAAAGDDPVIVLNHGRDLHNKFRPLDPSRHVSLTGERRDGQPFPATAMEIVNSGAVQTDPLVLVEDWMGLLARGYRVTPIGASDSHDVARLFVGQGRTYVRVPDENPGAIDVPAAVASVRRGAVLVSYGLLAEARIGEAGPGDLASLAGSDDLRVRVRVQGPSWVRADRVVLYVNGERARSERVGAGARGGTKWDGEIRVPRPGGDVFVTAVAVGAGVEAPYWPMAKPYQPTSTGFTPSSLGLSGAVFVDVDGNGRFDSPFTQAERLLSDNPSLEALARRLRGLDGVVATQVASLLRARDPAGFAVALARLASRLPASAARGLASYRAAVEP
jgi:hypothetical protein